MTQYYLYGAGWEGELVDVTSDESASVIHHYARPEMTPGAKRAATPDFQLFAFDVVPIRELGAVITRFAFHDWPDESKQKEVIQKYMTDK